MSVSTVAIKRPVTITMLFLGLAVLGLFAFTRIGVDLLPNVNLPHLIVQTSYSNATPEEVEALITEPLESQIGTVTGVKKITSMSKEGISVISVDFLWGTDMDIALLSLREKLDNIRGVLPSEAGRPNIVRSDPSSLPVMTLVLSFAEKPGNDYKISYADHSSPDYEIQRLIDLKEAGRVLFRRRLEQIEGVAQAVVTGGLEREILVEVNPAKLDDYSLTIADISSALDKANNTLPAGYIMKGLFRYSLNARGEFSTTAEIENTIVKNNGTLIKLKDVAVVKENFKEREGLTRLNGAETVGLLIYKEPEANTVTIANKIKNSINTLSSEYPEFELLIVSDHSAFIDSAIQNVKQEILYGGILAIIVLFFFLGSLRNIFAIGITIPSSLVLTILLMRWFDINFNIISLGGIAVGVGMLLDNSIVVIENIVRYKEMGLPLRQAAIKGAGEVTMPVVAATATTIVVFLPLIFMPGIAGELFKDQSYAIAFSLISSIAAAITLIPMIVSRKKLFSLKKKSDFEKGYLTIEKPVKGIGKKITFILKFPFVVLIKSTGHLISIISSKSEKIFSKFFVRIDRWMESLIDEYEKMLVWSLDNKKTTLLIALILAIISAVAILKMEKEFIPESPQEEFVVELSFPKGTSLQGNAELTEKFEKVINSIGEVEAVVANIGRVNEFDFLNKEQVSVNKTNLIVKLNSYEAYYPVQNKLREVFSNVKGIEYSFKQVKSTYSQLINPSENDLVIKIKNKNLDAAYIKANEIVNRVQKEKYENIKEIFVGSEKSVPGYNITINREKCSAAGLNIEDAASQLVNLVRGKLATSFSDFDKKVSIVVKSNQTQINNIEDILDQRIKRENFEIHLSKIVDVERVDTYNEIRREDESRTVYVYADVTEGKVTEAVDNINNLVSKLPKRQGEIIEIGGTNEEIKSSFTTLYSALLISVILMYMILASEFESFLFPFVIIFSVPLGLIGGIILLWLFGESLSIISLMGLIILVGIADNDAVVKVEFILRKRKEGLNTRDAIIAAGHERFRPIVMNSLTVICGLIPMIIGIGAGTQLRVSLSLAIAGGLVSSTVLTLIIIPVLYTYMERWSKKSFDELVE